MKTERAREWADGITKLEEEADGKVGKQRRGGLIVNGCGHDYRKLQLNMFLMVSTRLKRNNPDKENPISWLDE